MFPLRRTVLIIGGLTSVALLPTLGSWPSAEAAPTVTTRPPVTKPKLPTSKGYTKTAAMLPPPPSATPTCGSADCDGDGANSIARGGTDCDDTDPRRTPGRTEIADHEHLDEDCNPATFGRRDSDGDGYLDAQACNWTGSSWNCGNDCDDLRSTVHPGLAEVCNGLDDNCDGNIDDGVTGVFYQDRDGDGFGDASAPARGCLPAPATSVNATDCNDRVDTVHPGQWEVANGVDDDCDGRVDEEPLVKLGR